MFESQTAKPLWMLSQVHRDDPKSLCSEAGRSVAWAVLKAMHLLGWTESGKLLETVG